jgi:hypothetical protein
MSAGYTGMTVLSRHTFLPPVIPAKAEIQTIQKKHGDMR